MKLFLVEMKLSSSTFASSKPKNQLMKKFFISFIFFLIINFVNVEMAQSASHSNIPLSRRSNNQSTNIRAKRSLSISFEITKSDLVFSQISEECEYLIITDLNTNFSYYYTPSEGELTIPLLSKGDYMITLEFDSYSAIGYFTIN